jgi:hypothetical protein
VKHALSKGAGKDRKLEEAVLQELINGNNDFEKC